MTITVWVQLVRGGENIGSADKITLEDDESDLADLRKAVKVEFSNQLQAYDAAQLNVSTARESNEYLRADAEVKGIPTTYDKPLFVHAPALAGGSEQGASKRLSDGIPQPRAKVLKRSATTGVAQMWSCLHEVEEKEEGGWISYLFKHGILDSSRRSIWVRDVYSDFYDAMWRATEDPHDNKNIHPVIVTGTNGIGKSFFGVYATRRAVREKKLTVVYTVQQKNSVERYVIAPSLEEMQQMERTDPRRRLLTLREQNPHMLIGEDRVQEGESDHGKSMWWGAFIDNSANSSEFLSDLLAGEATWVYVDLQEGRLQATTKRLKAFISNKPKAYHSYEKHNQARRLYMPVWQPNEIENLRTALKLQISPEVLQERYDLVGGVPRSILVADGDWNTIKAKLLNAIDNLSPDRLQHILDPNSSTPEDVASMLMHVTSTTPFSYTERVAGYASKEVQRLIYNRFLLSEQFKLKVWLSYTRGLVSGGERGPKYELFAHVVLGRTQQALPIKITQLYTLGGEPTNINGRRRGEPVGKMLQQFAKGTKLFNTVSELNELKRAQYAQPIPDNYPAIDSFCVFKGVPWEEEAEDQGDVLLLFQMTVARKHPTQGQAIKDVIAQVNKFFTLERIILVFVVDDNLLPGAEAYLTVASTENKKASLSSSHLGELKRIEQVCLQLE